MRPHMVIVGAGIVGLSTAYSLLKRGCQVTVLEAGPIPSPIASSSDHHRLIRRVYGEEAGYCSRIGEAFDTWRTLWADLPGPVERYYSDTGILALSTEAGDYTDRSRDVLTRLGVAFEVIANGELSNRFPFLNPDGVAYAMVSEGGALWANAILVDLAAWLRAHGADVREHTPVASVDHKNATAHLQSGETVAGDRVVIAAGVRARDLAGEAANALVPHRSIVLYAEPPADLASAWDGAPCWTDLGGDSDLWGMAPLKGIPAKLANGALGRRDPTDHDRTIAPEEIEAILASYAGRFVGIERYRVAWGVANYWTYAPESRFHLAEVHRSLLVSACSGHGFKFGPLTGEDVAKALTGAATVAATVTAMAGQLPLASPTLQRGTSAGGVEGPSP
ncbi:MAG: FAD-dependent oxidoreductase [Pseudomonadota bacterium]